VIMHAQHNTTMKVDDCAAQPSVNSSLSVSHALRAKRTIMVNQVNDRVLSAFYTRASKHQKSFLSSLIFTQKDAAVMNDAEGKRREGVDGKGEKRRR